MNIKYAGINVCLHIHTSLDVYKRQLVVCVFKSRKDIIEERGIEAFPWVAVTEHSGAHVYSGK